MWLGPLAILVAWSVDLIIFFSFDRGEHYTFSSIGASHKKAYALFATSTFIAGVLIFFFFKNWMINALMLPRIFLPVAALGALFLQSIVAFVPRTIGLKRRIHDVAAYIECALLPVMGLIISRSPVLNKLVQYICLFIVIFMIYLYYEFKKRFLRPQFIYIQALYYGSFHLIVLLATFSVWIKG